MRVGFDIVLLEDECHRFLPVGGVLGSRTEALLPVLLMVLTSEAIHQTGDICCVLLHRRGGHVSSELKEVRATFTYITIYWQFVAAICWVKLSVGRSGEKGSGELFHT